MRKKILVANRAEIACRVFQTAKEMGYQTLGLQVQGDEMARHLSFCDEVISVPNYLDGDAIVAAAKMAKTHFVHPGYGFLSERSSFSKKVEESGMIFLGPRSETIEKMGGKIPSKELAEKLGIPVLPWAKVDAGGNIKEAAKKVGFPLLLKASSGGGGKGMRRVTRVEELDSALEGAKAEALSSFGEGTVFLERLLENARHIEVQVFGDGKGGGVHLYERDCSLQRRHQKIWEEARAPHLSDETVQVLHESALKLVKETKYRSAGTCEFLVSEEGQPYFLEMNTRLQVEHPVTESITGLDLVRAQIELGENPNQNPIHEIPTARGHSIEVRFYAEDPYQGYLPTPGKVEFLRFPMGPGIRVDSGIEEGQVIPPHFDSMLAKLIVHAPDRKHAVARLKWALGETFILGMGTNQSFLSSLCEDEKVKEGKPAIDYLTKMYSNARPSFSEKDAEVLSQFQKMNSTHFLSNASDREPEFKSPWKVSDQ